MRAVAIGVAALGLVACAERTEVEASVVRQITARLRWLVSHELSEQIISEAPKVEANLARVCRHGNGAACHAVTEMKWWIPRELFELCIESCEYERLACERNHYESCEDYLRSLRRGECGGSKARWPALAGPVFERLFDGCRAGRWRACYEQTRMDWDAARRNPDHLPIGDEARFESLAERACERGESVACERLGDSFDRKWIGDSPYRAAALRIREAGCEDDSIEDCQWLADVWVDDSNKRRNGEESDPYKAAAYAFRVCELGDIAGCRSAGTLWSMEVDIPVINGVAQPYGTVVTKKDGDRISYRSAPPPVGVFRLAEKALRRACDEGLAEVCWKLGGLYDTRSTPYRDDAKAHHYYKRARALLASRCERGFAGCHTLSLMTRSGDGGPRDMKKHSRYQGLGCDHEWDHMCHDAAMAYTRGNWVPVDLPRARRYLKKVCDRGRDISWACMPLAEMCETGRGGETDPKAALRAYRMACGPEFDEGCEHVERLTGQPAAPWTDILDPLGDRKSGAGSAANGRGGP